MHIGLAIDDRDWHARALLAAFAAKEIAVTPFRLSEARFDTTCEHGLSLPGFETTLPEAVLVRAISGGSFEEVTRRLGILHALREMGVVVWNDARSIERCVDKSTTSFLLARARVPTLATWTVEGCEAAAAIAARECRAGPLVLKPLFGSQGKGLRLISGSADLPPSEQVGGVYYLQRYLPARGEVFRDHRLFVCGGHVIAAMTRQSDHWVTNIHMGAKAAPFSPDAAATDIAVRAAAAVGACYAGVDIIQDSEGRHWVLEVNSMPGWKGLQRVTAASIAEQVVEGFIAALA
jgi:RimK family alpha-L-glutamate ligase